MSYSSLYQHIYDLQDIRSYSKHEVLVSGIINAINEKKLGRGDKLPSINEMVSELGYARKTIVKAYDALKDRGIIESKKLKGYYIASEETSQVLKVALILYAFHTFQEDFYNHFRKNLGERVQLDVFFHHNNETLLETILLDIDKKYGMYVIAPIPSASVAERLKNFPPEKLLLVDRYLDLGPGYSFITQEFTQTTYQKLTELLPDIQKYEQVTLFFRGDADYPEGIQEGFLRFVQNHQLNFDIQPRYEKGSLEKGRVYIFISDSNLFLLLKDAAEQGISVGQDIGIISHNDQVVKELLAGGITTISTDFQQMGELAAQAINARRAIQHQLSTKLMRRKSL